MEYRYKCPHCPNKVGFNDEPAYKPTCQNHIGRKSYVMVLVGEGGAEAPPSKRSRSAKREQDTRAEWVRLRSSVLQACTWDDGWLHVSLKDGEIKSFKAPNFIFDKLRLSQRPGKTYEMIVNTYGGED